MEKNISSISLKEILLGLLENDKLTLEEFLEFVLKKEKDKDKVKILKKDNY